LRGSAQQPGQTLGAAAAGIWAGSARTGAGWRRAPSCTGGLAESGGGEGVAVAWFRPAQQQRRRHSFVPPAKLCAVVGEAGCLRHGGRAWGRRTELGLRSQGRAASAVLALRPAHPRPCTACGHRRVSGGGPGGRYAPCCAPARVLSWCGGSAAGRGPALPAYFGQLSAGDGPAWGGRVGVGAVMSEPRGLLRVCALWQPAHLQTRPRSLVLLWSSALRAQCLPFACRHSEGLQA